jgi:hypothetical protein
MPSAPSSSVAASSADPNAPVSSHHEAAFDKCVAAIVPDMPLLMHGAGDVRPTAVRDDTAVLLAQLTTEYMTKLVSAAVDAHDILTDGAGGMLPPPSEASREIHPLPYSEERKRKRKTPGEEYWDDPVPDPVIKPQSSSSSSSSRRHHHSSSSSSSTTKTPAKKPWVGLAGVDLQEATRTRKKHIQQAIGTQSFIFPICHDAELYQRVMQLQAARREIQQVLEDSVVMDLIHTEHNKDLEEEEEAAAAETAMMESEWPGLRAFLPIHAFLEEKEEQTPATSSTTSSISSGKTSSGHHTKHSR